MKNNFDFNRNIKVCCKEHCLELGHRTHLMGILNVTPDSFSDGGQFIDPQSALQHARDMVTQGADIIDVGGESTRPGHTPVTAEEEIRRVLPVVECLVSELDVPVSVDTSKAVVADKVLAAGAHMINDIWGLQGDPDMAAVLAEHDAPVVIMHNQEDTHYAGDIMEEIKAFLTVSMDIATSVGIRLDNIILDPGIGFGKTPEQNILVMSRLHELNNLGRPLLLGASRKSMIGKVLNLDKSQRLEGTLATSIVGVLHGVDIIRVHDVRENHRAVMMTDAIVRGEYNG